MKKYLLALLFLCTSAFADCDHLLPWGYPIVHKQTVALCQIAFFTSWNPDTKNPDFSAELLLLENVSGIENRKGIFKPHPNIPPEIQASNRDYSKSGYDRGHLAPAGDMRKDSAAMEQSFYLTNMAPQRPGLNRVDWAQLESFVRKHVYADRPLYVITGPIYIGSPKVIGNNVWVPSYFYKIIYDKNANAVSAYVMPNIDEVTGNINSYRVNLQQIEAATGIEFFPLMPVEYRKSLRQLRLDDVR